MSREGNSQAKSCPQIPNSLVEPLRRMVLAVEWFRAAYPLKENPKENRLLYQQLAEMKRQIELLEAEFCKNGNSR